MVCTSKKCIETEIVKTLEGDVKVYRRKDCAFHYSPFEGIGAIGSIMGGTVGTLMGGVLDVPVGALTCSHIAVGLHFEECKRCGCDRSEHKEIYTEQIVRRNAVADPALLARISEKRKELSSKEAVKLQLIEEHDFCCKEAAKWISFLKSMAVKTFDDEMLRYIEQSIRDTEGKMGKLKGQSNEEQQKSIDAHRLNSMSKRSE